ncbi:MAG: beta-lactamase family protein [Sphingomonadales bacterium]|nr:beta-lactamase family protein [Sphingomonadales bacterium]
MNTNRRHMLGLTVGAAAVAALPARTMATASSSGATPHAVKQIYGPAIDALHGYASKELVVVGFPGMAITIVGRDGLTETIGIGWADVEAQVPVDSSQLFQIGSISKSITALCLHILAEKGLVDLGAPVSRYVSGVPLPEAPITVWDLLNHVGGLAHDAPVFPRNPEARLWTGLPPGERYSYSNIGYVLLGMVIARVTGRPHPEVIEDLVLRPLGMDGAVAQILLKDRARYAVGYVPFAADRPLVTRSRMSVGPFREYSAAAGAVSASAKAMAGYLRFLLDLGQSKGAPLLSDEAARTLLARYVDNDEAGPGSRYASGLSMVRIDDRAVLHHTGGVATFSSSLHVDPEAGVACFASVNGRLIRYRPSKVTAYAIQLLRAAKSGAPLPAPPDPSAFRVVKAPQRLVGRYAASDGRSLELVSTAGGLTLRAEGMSGRIEQADKGSLATDHPGFGAKLLQYEPGGDGPVDRIWWGETLLVRGAPVPPPAANPALVPFAGVYVSGIDRSTVFVRGNALHLEGTGEIVLRPGGFWSPVDDPGGVKRYWFGSAVNGRPFEMCNCGSLLQRLM